MKKAKKYPDAPEYTVIKDTREQDGYNFSKFALCKGMMIKKLDTGDYTIKGFEDKICVERKACVAEVAQNLGQKKYAFFNEIERMKEYDHRYIVMEFTLEELLEFPKGAHISQANKKQIRITGKYILRMLMEFQLYDNVHVIFAGNKKNAFLFISSLFKRINEKYTIGRTK